MKIESTPSFFKLYLPDHNSNHLLIPPPFIKYFNGDIPKKVKLRNLQGKLSNIKTITQIANAEPWQDFPKAVIKACDQHGLPQKVTLREEKGCVVESVLRKITDRFRLGGQGFNELCRKTKVKIGDKLDFEVILGEGRKIKEIRLKITHKSKRKKAN